MEFFIVLLAEQFGVLSQSRSQLPLNWKAILKKFLHSSWGRSVPTEKLLYWRSKLITLAKGQLIKDDVISGFQVTQGILHSSPPGQFFLFSCSAYWILSIHIPAMWRSWFLVSAFNSWLGVEAFAWPSRITTLSLPHSASHLQLHRVAVLLMLLFSWSALFFDGLRKRTHHAHLGHKQMHGLTHKCMRIAPPRIPLSHGPRAYAPCPGLLAI